MNLSSNVSEEVRKKLEDKELSKKVRKVAEDVDEFIANLKRQEYKDGWPENRWEEEMEKHPLFTSKINEGEELPPLVEAFQALKYSPECNTPVELAEAHKIDGNEHFKQRKYNLAAVAYTEGLKVECGDDNLTSVLYSNRANAYFNMGKYAEALNDAKKSIELNPSNAKAFYRSAQCYFKMDKYEDCISWCEEGLKIKKNDKALLDLKDKALRMIEHKRLSQKEVERKKKELEKLNNAIKERGISLIDEGLTLDTVQYDYNGSVAKVHMAENGILMWPVVLFYPEYNTTDFIPAVNEEYCLFEYLMDLFVDPAGWDVNLEYTIDNLKIYFADSEGNIVPVEEMMSLKSVMQNKRFQVTTGHLSFFVTSSQFDPRYRSQNHVVDF